MTTRREGLLIEALKDLLEWTDQNSSHLPTYEACDCGGDPHEGRPCGQGACECQEFTLRDPEGHALRKRIKELLE